MGCSSSSFVAWAWEASREFSVKKWLEKRYPFQVVFPPFRLVTARPAGWAWSPAREFPAQVWLEQQASASV